MAAQLPPPPPRPAGPGRRAYPPPGFWFPVALIAAGLVALLANLGLITYDQLARVFDLWPLLLIVFGVWLIVRRSLPAPVATSVGAAIAIIAVVAAIAYAAAGAPSLAGHSGSASAPLSSAETGHLIVSGGGITFTARVGDVGDNLYDASYRNPSGQDPSFENHPGSVTVRYESGRQLFGSFGPRSLDMKLNGSVAWTITLDGGGYSADVDLRGGDLKALSLEGGGISLGAHLPQPHGTVPISVSGGGINAVLHRPAGVEARVTVTGGGSSIEADGTEHSALAGEVTWTSSGYREAGDRYDVMVAGGGTHVSIDSTD